MTRVVVRVVDHAIPVDFSSSNFYRTHLCENTEGATLDNDSTNDSYYDGHPFSFGVCNYTLGNIPYWRLERIIIVDSTTVIFIAMDVPVSVANRPENATTSVKGTNDAFVGWVNFENSLVIR
jgi:hypothetical protein